MHLFEISFIMYAVLDEGGVFLCPSVNERLGARFLSMFPCMQVSLVCSDDLFELGLVLCGPSDARGGLHESLFVQTAHLRLGQNLFRQSQPGRPVAGGWERRGEERMG